MKLDCDIIRDLLPSYVDEVCSERSRAVVEEHVGECAACRSLLERQRMTDFSAEKLEERELNGLKKIRSRMKRQTMISYALGILLLLLGWNSFHGFELFSQLFYYLLLPVCMLAVYQTGKQEELHMGRGGVDLWLSVGAAVLICISIGLLTLSLTQALEGGAVLGVPPEQAGPRLAMLWGVCFLMQLVIMGVLLYRQLRLKVENRFRLCICITGVFLLFVYVEALRNLVDVTMAKQNFLQMSAVVFVLGALGTLLCYFRSRGRE